MVAGLIPASRASQFRERPGTVRRSQGTSRPSMATVRAGRCMAARKAPRWIVLEIGTEGMIGHGACQERTFYTVRAGMAEEYPDD